MIANCLQSITEDAHVFALEQSARHISISLATHTPLSRSQQQRLSGALRSLAAPVRWTTPATFRISLPIAIPLDAPLAVCVPILRRGRNTLWWPLASIGHLVLAGDTDGALAAMLQAVVTVAERQPITLALHDPEGELQNLTLPGLTATSDALAMARLRALRAAWAAHQQQPIRSEPALILIVVAPDTLAWREIAPLLQGPGNDIYTFIILSNSDAIAEARDACHRVAVLEIGGPGVTLPESHRLPGIAEPRVGEALARRPERNIWRGAPIRPAE
jgi:hypothetical protein